MSSERDWKLFRKRLPEWQERCVQSLLNEYAASREPFDEVLETGKAAEAGR